jgi:hypothetical protein
VKDNSRVNLKNPWIAAFLAFLLPGAGHFYQGRMFKAGIYAVCILGTFFGGMALGDWQTCYYRKDARHTHYGYISQFMVGIPALPALVQARRYRESMALDGMDGQDESLLDTRFEGVYLSQGQSMTEGVPIRGSLRGEIVRERTDSGGDELQDAEFIGIRTDTGEEFGLTLEGPPQVGQRISPSPDRMFACHVVDDDGVAVGTVDGTIPRSFWNWFQMPLQESNLEHLHGTLGKRFDLALVFTWIAGLLNVLAIWDALEGPAYGYGDEPEPEDA